jgi:16S rRNA processing protein RimM
MILGRVVGHRGKGGEMTVRVASGDADRWTGLREVGFVSREGEEVRSFRVESSRAYRDRLVLKLRSIDDSEAAERWRGYQVVAGAKEVPELPEGTFYRAHLIGLDVLEEGRRLGTVREVVETGAADLLQVEGDDGEELLIPMVQDMIQSIDERKGTVSVRLPEGLRELNRPRGRRA